VSGAQQTFTERDPRRHTAKIKERLDNAARPSVPGRIRSTSRLE